MQFTFETLYNQKALTTMARALRRTVRKKKSRTSHIVGWIIVVLCLPLILMTGEEGFVVDLRTVVTILALLFIVIALIWEDAINGYFARKRMLAGTDKIVSVFEEEGFYSTTEVGKSEWKYNKILMLAESRDYFIFVFSASHAQVYDKKNLTGGTIEEFRTFIAAKTGKEVQQIKS